MNGSDEGPLPHEEAVGLLDALRDGELSPSEAARVEAHLESCERCQAVEAALGGGLREAVSQGEAASQPDLLDGVQRKIRLRSRGRFYAREEKQRSGISSWPLVIASVAVLVALAASYVLLGQVAGPTNAPSPPASPKSS